MVIPTLEPLDIAAKTITADALLTQRKLANHLSSPSKTTSRACVRRST
jgi:hypothetical protein